MPARCLQVIKAAFEMKILLFTITTILTFEPGHIGQSPKGLTGHYAVVLDGEGPQFKQRYELEIADSIATVKKDFLLTSYSVIRISDNHYRLIDKVNPDTSQLTKLDKVLLDLGQPFYDLTRISADSITFDYNRNLYIRIASGLFIRTK